jgi:localization factor PodJL
MKSGVPWHLSGVRRQARETAREAARRAGMSIGEWLDSIILQSAQSPDVDSNRPAEREYSYDDDEFREDEVRTRRSTYIDGYYDDRPGSQAGEHRDQSGGHGGRHRAQPADHHGPFERESPPERFHEKRAQPSSWELHPRAAAPGADQLASELEQRLPFARSEDRPAIHQGFAELNQRLDELTRQLSHVATLSAAKAARPDPRSAEPSRQLVEVISKLDRRLDQLIAEGRSGKTEIEQRVNAVGRAIADLNRERPVAVVDPLTPLDQALSEIADRQRTLDGYAPAGSGTASSRAAIPSEGLPRARTQELSGLEQQLRQINAQIEGLKPCGVDKAIDTLRDDLAEIGVMLQDAMPRESVEAIEQEMRKLADRIDHSRNAGADGAALASVEHGLAEVRDALRGLAPAENLPAVDRELQKLSQKIDVLAHNSQNPAALRQLESAIVGLRGIVSHVASNDALTSLSDEVRALAGKVDRATANSGSDSVLNALEQRIGAIADALAARNQVGQSVPYELEAVIKGLVDKIERVQLTRGDHAALGHLEDRIAKLVEKLDASDARLNHLEAIERGLAELLIHLEHQRVPNLARAASPPPEVDELSRDVANLRQTEKKTQETLEVVHGTLGHVVDRLAMIETDMRSKPVRRVESSAGQTASVVPAAPATPKPVASPAPGAVVLAVKKDNRRDDKKADKNSKAVNSPSLPEVTATKSSLQSAALAPALQPIEFLLREPARLDEAPGADHRPIDPTLPPDHPLEPGSSGSRRGHAGWPADRIAASESVLVGAKPPAILESGGKPNFIAAARRAAQAAGRETPVKSAASGPREIVSAAGKLVRRVGKLRALIAGTTTIVIVLGALHIARTLIHSPQEADVVSPDGQSPIVVAKPESPAVVAIPIPPDVSQVAPASSGPPSPKLSFEPPTGRQSAVFPAIGTSPLPASGTVTPIEIPRQATATIPQPMTSAAIAAERDITSSIPVPSIPAPSIPIPSIPGTADSATAKPPVAAASAANAPSIPTPAPTPTQQTSALSPTDKLPATFGSGLRAAAAKGDAAAQYEIAQRYAEGHGVAQSLAGAVEWFERAAKQGLAPAQFRLGGLYEKGLGVKKSLETARRFYIAAGEAGNAKALHNLAVLYAEGIDGKPDYQTAARWFRKAAGYGIADSQYNLAILYARGIGVQQNLAEAYKWFALAAQDGDMEAAKKRDDLGAHLDRQSHDAAMAAIQAWVPEHQPEAAVQVKTPPGGWDQAAVSPPIVAAKRKPPVLGPKLDLATPPLAQ